MLKHISISTAQGLGDIHWVIQKLSPYCKTINIEILLFNNTTTEIRKRHNRTVPWLNLYQKAGCVNTMVVSEAEYERIISQKTPLEDVLNKGGNYCVNSWLEEGIKLKDIDPGADIDWEPTIAVENSPPINGDYVVLFAGDLTFGWASEHFNQVAAFFKLPIVCIGAEWDASAKAGLKADYYMVNESPSKVAAVIRNAKAFIGYQSGLSILADTFHVPINVMLYYPWLRPMFYTWYQSSGYLPFTIEQTPLEVIRAIDNHPGFVVETPLEENPALIVEREIYWKTYYDRRSSEIGNRNAK